MNTLSASFLATYVGSCVEQGANKADLLALIPGAPQDFGSDNSAASEQRFPVGVIFEVFALATKATGKPGIGLLCGQDLRPATLNELGSAIMCCETPRQVIMLNRRYQGLTQQLGRSNLKTRGDQAHIIWEPHVTDVEYNRMVTDVVMAGYAVFWRRLSWVHDKKINAVHFRHVEPSYSKLYTEIFDCPVLFDQTENAILLDIDVMDVPLPQGNEKVLTEICHRLDAALAQLIPNNLLRERVADVLYVKIPKGPINLEQTARHLGMSPRGLRRNLTNEQTSFRKILETTRRQLCEEYLGDNIPLFTIAARLGYSQQSAFNRAFKGWFSATPKAYVKAQKIANVAFDQLAP